MMTALDPDAQPCRVGQAAGGEVVVDQSGKLGLASLIVGEHQKVDHASAGVALIQGCVEDLPGLAVGAAW